MKTEQEKLNNIIELIGYITKSYVYHDYIGYYEEIFIDNGLNPIKYKRYLDIREIIFTKEFIDKFIEYSENLPKNIMGKEFILDILGHGIIRNLDNPLDYLYNLVIKE